MMALDFQKWHANEMKRRPRRAGTRWLLALGLALIAALPVIEVVAPGDADAIFPNVFPMALPLILASAWSPFTRDTIFTRRGMAAYDEFERAALHGALRQAYLTMVVVVVLLFVWLIVGTRAGWPVPTLPRQWGAIGFAMVMAMLALPATFAEFTVPMPDPDDEML